MISTRLCSKVCAIMTMESCNRYCLNLSKINITLKYIYLRQSPPTLLTHFTYISTYPLTNLMAMTEKVVELNIYEINKTTKFYSYTALWCPPCRKIKPFIVEKMSEYKLIETKQMPLSEFKSVSQYIPFFSVYRSSIVKIDKPKPDQPKTIVQFNMTESIQSSNEHDMSVFLYKAGIGKIPLVEDF